MASPRSHYDTLGVVPHATEAQIRKRFKELARRMHPDRFHGESEKAKAELEFQAVTQAFNILIDPNRRREHDFELAHPTRSGEVERDEVRRLRAYLQRGRKAYRERAWAQAADSFQRAAETAPNSAEAWFELARACSQNPRWLAQAVEASRRACEIQPMKVTYLRFAGELHARAGFTAKAQKFYTDALNWGGPDPAIERVLLELDKAR